MRIGLIVNPVAGMGGSVGLKGTDGDAYLKAMKLGAVRSSHLIAERALRNMRGDVSFATANNMGGDVLDSLNILYDIVPMPSPDVTSGDDTKKAAELMKKDCDIILFCGGDGTAIDILNAVGTDVPVLGIPAGVKMYSSVFATSPENIPEIVDAFIDGRAELTKREVMDINEEDHRNGVLSSKLYGYLTVPYIPALVQNCKGTYEGGNEDEEADEVAEYMITVMDTDTLYIIGPGSTTGRIMERMSLEHTVLGIDAVIGGKIIGTDLNENTLIRLIKKHQRTVLILGITGRQGFFLGRGNKELTPKVIRMIGTDNIILVSGITKLNDLKEIHADTGDPALDEELKGYRKVVFMFGRERLMKVA